MNTPSQTHVTDVLSPELLAQVKRITWRALRLVKDIHAGSYKSAFKGRGMEFEKVREYQPGDDVRHIDWNVTARMRAPFVKEYREERELTVMLLVDVSSSQAFGSQQQLKQQLVAEIAAVLAYTAIANQDRVGLIMFSDRLEHFIPAKKGRAHVWRVIRDILSFAHTQRGTDIKLALNHLNQLVKRRAVGFIVSDFLDDSFGEALTKAASKHDLTAISVVDPREQSLPASGLIALEDAESGECIVVDTFDEHTRQRFALLQHSQREQRQAYFRAAKVPEIEIFTDRPYIDSMVRFFARTKHRLSR